MEFLNRERKLLHDINISSTSDKAVLWDVFNFRHHHAVDLIKRVEKLQSFITTEDHSDEWICNFIKAVICCYLECTESIKLSRAVFKLLQPWRLSHEQIIEEEFELFLRDVIGSDGNNKQQLIAASNFLENNEVGKGLFEKRTVGVLEWLNNKFDGLLTVGYVTDHDKGLLYTYTRIVLQLYQFCPLKFAVPVFNEIERDTVIPCRKLLQHLLLILSKENVSVDCHFLCGIAVCLVLTKQPDVDLRISSFWSIYNRIITETGIPSDVLLKPMDSKADKVRHTTGHLALLRGILTHWNIFFKKTSFLIFCFEEVMELCIGSLSMHYHAFTTLEQLLSKVLHLLPSITTADIVHVSSSIINVVIKTVFLNWDSPVQDVPQIVIRIFSLMLQIWQHTYKLGSCHDIIPDLLSHLQSVAWNVKGQYRVISALVPFVDTEKLFSSRLKNQLLMCMTTNYLAAVGSDVYKSFLITLNSLEKKEIVWDCLWKNVIVEGLTSSNRLQRINVGHYWVPSTLKFLPGVRDNLLTAVLEVLYQDTRSQVLHGWAIVSNAIRSSTGDLPSDMNLLHEALWSNDDDTRSEALSIICTSLKKADRLRDVEARLLKECLPYNLKIDSAPFRQQLASNIKKLMVRMRDSYKAMLKDKDKQSIERSFEFIDWFNKFCIDNLVIGASFQRIKMCLEFLQITLEIFFPTLNNYPVITVEAQKRGLWKVYGSIETVLHCLLDGADEVQNIASKLLLHYFPWPLTPTDQLTSPEEFAKGLLISTLELCNRPKQHESRSGVLLCLIIFVKYVSNLKWHFTWSYEEGNFMVTSVEKEDKSSCEKFLLLLLNHIFKVFQESKQNPVKSSTSSPLHGFLGALTACLKEIADNHKSDEILVIVLKLVDLNCTIINGMMDIMAKESSDGACPSFAELGLAMESLIEEIDTDYSGTSHISSQHQFLLSWCWINIKECCHSLGCLCAILLRLNGMTERMKVIKQIQNVFLSVLTKCRHRGVIEGCRSSFIQFIGHLFSSGKIDIQFIPGQILEEIFERFSCNSSSTSITRRSAGLPIVIQAIVTVERKYKQTTLLQYSVNKLFQMSGDTLPTEYNDQHDLPQVHGLNILNTLFGDSSLSIPMIPYIGKAVILVIGSFESPAWSIRNAATMLFSSLVMRIFGQKKNCTDEEMRGVSVIEFSALYPELPPLMDTCLHAALQKDMKKIDKIKTSLFPVLTLLAYLRPVDSLTDQIHIALGQKVFQFLSSPVLYLRNLAASAYVAFIPLRCMDKTLQTLDTVIQNAGTNQLHGILTFIHKLTLQDLGKDYSSAIKSLLIINENLYCSPCGMVRAKHIQLLKDVCRDSPKDLSCVASMIQSNFKCHPVKISESIVLEEEITIHLKASILNGSKIDKLLEKYLCVSSILSSESCVNCIRNNLSEMRENDLHTTQDALSKYLLSDVRNYYPLISGILQLVIDIHSKVNCSRHVVDNLEGFLRKGPLSTDSSVTSKIMVVKAICIEHSICNKRSDKDEIENWSKEVYNASKMIGAEHFKMAAGYCLKITGQKVIELGKNIEDLHLSVFLLIRSALNLVEDEDTKIRNCAVDFIVSLQWSCKEIKYKSIVFSRGSEMMYNFLCDEFWHSSHIIKDLHQMLYNPGSVKQIYQKRVLNRRQNLFEKEDKNCFSEKFLHHCQICKSLMVIFKKYREKRIMFPVLPKEPIMSDIDVLTSLMSSNSGFLAVLTDGIALEIVGGLLLAAYLITVVSDGKLQMEGQYLLNFIQRGAFPASFRNRLLTLMQDCSQ